MAHLEIKNLRVHRIGPLSLSVERGECVVVSGPSGAGKTLLLRSIADLEPHEGEAILDGVRSSDVPAPEWRRKVGMLASESHWWRDTVGEHFNAVSSDDFGRLGLPPSVMGWKVNRLSTGERQRLALLRLLSNSPRVLLLDEPTANLDPDNLGLVEDLLNEYRAQEAASVIWVSHDAAQIRRVADRHLVLQGGVLRAGGTS